MQLHINAHAADGIESHMRSPLVFHIYIECLGSLPRFMTCRGSRGVNGGHITFVGQGTIHIPTHHDHTASYLPIPAYEWLKTPPPGAQHHIRHAYGVSSPPYKYAHACESVSQFYTHPSMDDRPQHFYMWNLREFPHKFLNQIVLKIIILSANIMLHACE